MQLYVTSEHLLVAWHHRMPAWWRQSMGALSVLWTISVEKLVGRQCCHSRGLAIGCGDVVFVLYLNDQGIISLMIFTSQLKFYWHFNMFSFKFWCRDSCIICLSHWRRVTHICISKLTIIGSDDGLSPERRQAIIWTNAGISLIGPLWTNLSVIIPPAQRSNGFTPSVSQSVRPSVRPASVQRPSRIPCPLCSFYSSGWILFIFIHLIKQLQNVCPVQSFLQNCKIWSFGNFLKILTLTLCCFNLGFDVNQ